MQHERLLTAPTAVPFFDLAPSHEGLKAEILGAISDLIDDGTFINGAAVGEFETAFAASCSRACCVGASSGHSALRVSLLAAGIAAGDEVIVPAMTFVATYEAVTQAGGRPIVADISAQDYGLDPAAAEAVLGERTRFIVPVHLYGQLCDVRALRSVADRHGLAIIEDACQAHGAERDGIRAGAAGVAAAFSFYPGKNLGAFGDAGALVTDDVALAERARALREHGQRAKYRHDVEGYTARLDTIQALVLLRKLPLLEQWNAERRAAASYYATALDGVGDLVLPQVPDGSDPVWHLYVVRTAEPQRLAGFLAARGIGTGRHYPEPPHLTRAYAWLGHLPGSFPVAESLAREALSLPLFPGIGDEQLEAVVEAIREYFGDG
jgi:dTDP-4-amino-4,6-dideoxygalactose transaminase